MRHLRGSKFFGLALALVGHLSSPPVDSRWVPRRQPSPPLADASSVSRVRHHDRVELRPGLSLEEALGRPVELRTPEDLSPYFRDEVTTTARPLYAA